MGFFINDPEKIWPDGIVPFIIDPRDFPPFSASWIAIMEAISFWQSTTIIRFVTGAAGDNPDYVYFKLDSTACNSPVGRQGGEQKISCALGGGGFKAGTIAHEIGHALGFFHEHQRPDRDAVVAVAGDAKPADYVIKHNGIKVGPYDCGSIMHYGNQFGLIRNIDPACAAMGQRKELSPGDIDTVIEVYGLWRRWFIVSPGSPFQPGLTVTALEPRDDHIDLFLADSNGVVWSTWWEPKAGWLPAHFRVSAGGAPSATFAPRSTVTPLLPRDNHIDLFVTDPSGGVWSTFWDPAAGWLPSWFPIAPGGQSFQPGATVAAVVPRDGQIYVFVTDRKGEVWSTWWEEPRSWQAWSKVRPGTLPSNEAMPGGNVTALVPRPGHIYLFITDHTGVVWSIFWEPPDGQTNWKPIGPGTSPLFQPRATVTALQPGENHIDLFITDKVGNVWSTWWEPDSDWEQWFPISPGPAFWPGATVTALVPRRDHIDLFVTGQNNAVWSTYWEPGKPWQPWFQVNPGPSFQQRATVTALAPRDNHIDLFVPDANNIWSTFLGR
jgi:hypothetical protein